jgi:hypothetical protein
MIAAYDGGDAAAGGMELMGELEHGTSAPGTTDRRKGQSETGTGTDDDGSETTNEREDHSRPAEALQFEDELQMDDGKAPHPYDPQMAHRDGCSPDSGKSDSLIEANGHGQTDERDRHCAGDEYLREEPGHAHKRKICDLSDAQLEGLPSYQLGGHHQGCSESSFPARSMVAPCVNACRLTSCVCARARPLHGHPVLSLVLAIVAGCVWGRPRRVGRGRAPI